MQSTAALNPLVHIESGCAISAIAIFAHSTDPVFQPSGSVNLNDAAQEAGDRTTKYLAHSVVRKPGCLLTHAQRIALHIKRKEPDGVQGALLDLFIVLGTRGEPLRQRMLKAAKPLLSQQLFDFFLSSFRQGISATDVLPSSPYSVLTQSLTGTTELVKPIRDLPVHDREPLQEARECLEFGQVDQARRILEAAILHHPEHPQIHHDLLEIYRYTADKERFSTMRSKLQPKNNPLAQLWDSMAGSFEEAANQ
jgi:hypothetical protein